MDRHTQYFGALKRFHPSDNGKERDSLLPPGLANAGKSDHKSFNSTPDYNRSLSSPATFDPLLDSAQPTAVEGEIQPEAGANRGLDEGMEDGTKTSESNSCGSVEAIRSAPTDDQAGDLKESNRTSDSVAEVSQATVIEKSEVEACGKPLDIESTAQDPNAKTPLDRAATEEPPEVPKAFNFSAKLPEQDSGSDQDTQPQGEDEKAVSEPENRSEKEGVFVFTASDPTSPDQVPVKRKNAAVGFCFSPEQEREGEQLGRAALPPEVKGDEDMALLAQQLGLESDNVRMGFGLLHNSYFSEMHA